MNIFATVINSVQASAADLSVSAGQLAVTGLGKTIPLKGVVNAFRGLPSQIRQVFTWTVSSAATNASYRVSITGVDSVSGIMRTWTANYNTKASATTTEIINAVTAIINSFGPSCPAVAVATSSTVMTVTAKSGTPSILVAANLGTVANATAAIAGTVAISTAGALTGSGTAFTTGLAVGQVVVSNDGTDFYSGVVTSITDNTNATVLPLPPAAIASGSSLIAGDNTGATLEALSTYAELVTLTDTNRYIMYVIDAVDTVAVGNGARPDFIESRYLLFINAGDADVWTSSTGFDARLQTLLGFTF